MIEAAVIRGTEFRSWDKDKGATAARRAIPERKLAGRRLEEGDLVLEVSGGGPQQPVGRTILIDRLTLDSSSLPLTCSNFCRRIQLSKCVDPGFVWWALRSLYARGHLDQYQTQTTNLRNLNVTDFLDGLQIAIAPQAEQTRIVAKVEELLTRVNVARERIAKAPTILKRFRQSVLAAACSGQLTADWRETRGIIDGESEELPSSWQIHPLRDLCSDFQYGSSQKSSKQGRVPVLRMGNLQDGKLDWSDLVYSNDDIEISKYALADDTVLFNRTNSPELVGKTALYRGERPAIFAGYLIRIVTGDELSPKFLNLALNSPDFKTYCSEGPCRTIGWFSA